MAVAQTDSADAKHPCWVTVFIGSALTLTVVLASFSAALMLAIGTESLRLTYLVLLACGAALLALPRPWRWLSLACYLGLAAFRALLTVLASAPNYGDLLAG